MPPFHFSNWLLQREPRDAHVQYQQEDGPRLEEVVTRRKGALQVSGTNHKQVRLMSVDAASPSMLEFSGHVAPHPGKMRDA